MNKTAIKNYAIWARNALIDAVKQRAFQYGITEKNSGDPNADSVNGFVLTPSEKQQRQALIGKIREKGYEQVCEEVAYTWFNRFIALRFMEVNGYLPSRVRVFTDEENAFKPQILSEATHLELDGLKLDRVIALKEANKTEELFKYLLITHCNALSAVLPGMFQKIEDYTELLLPDNLLREGSVIEQMVTAIPEEDWTDQVQIIGWLYQYYNTEPKDKVFADLKKNIKISKEKIPAATQLFTPDWIVRYMVENSLGRLWVEGHPNDELKASWRYYLEEAEQKPEVKAQLAEIRKGYAALNPEDLRVIDPCCGSGHILCYLFDVLMQIYEASGYTARDAAQSILIHNLWGLDIDERAAQLSYFAIMMKARQYDRRFFSRNIQPHVYSIAESNGVSSEAVAYFCKGDAALTKAMQTILTELHDAKEYGSILTCSRQDWDALYARFNEVYDDIALHREEALALLPMVQTAEALSLQYDVVVTNPPYMNANGMNNKLGEYIKKNYPSTCSDLSTVFMERTLSWCHKDGFMAMINIPVWMFITSYTDLRKVILHRKSFVSMLHFGRGVFGSDFGTTSFVVLNSEIRNKKSRFYKLYLRQGEVNSVEEKEKMFFDRTGEFISTQDEFDVIPDSPIAYWASKELLQDFAKGQYVSTFASPKQGMSTCDVNRFTKLWYEIPINRTNIRYSKNTDCWVRYNKGGSFRKWYGNREYLVYWGHDGSALLANGALLRNRDVYFKPFIAWTKISSAGTGFRIFEEDFLFDGAGGSLFNKHCGAEDIYLLGLLNSKVNTIVLNLISPTLNFNENHIGAIPLILCEETKVKEEIESLVNDCISISKKDWDSFEASWDFQRHPLV